MREDLMLALAELAYQQATTPTPGPDGKAADFDMKYFLARGRLSRGCGFSACMIGHGILAGVLPDLEFFDLGTLPGAHAYGVNHKATGAFGFLAVALQLEIPCAAAEGMFSEHRTGGARDTFAAVAERIRDYVAKNQPESGA